MITMTQRFKIGVEYVTEFKSEKAVKDAARRKAARVEHDYWTLETVLDNCHSLEFCKDYLTEPGAIEVRWQW